MEPIPSVHERSLRRSRHRLRVLLALSSLGEAYMSQLARHTRLPVSRVRAALLGAPPAYRTELSLVALDLAREVPSPHGRTFVVTTKGRRNARSITAAMVRGSPAREVALRVAADVPPIRAGEISPDREGR